MSNPRNLTGSEMAVRGLAIRAKDSPNGIVVHFYFKDYTTKDACRRAARSLQMAFGSLKNKDRARLWSTMKHLDGANEMTFVGPFDHLGNYLREAEEGWDVRITPKTPDPYTVTDAGTGEVLEL